MCEGFAQLRNKKVLVLGLAKTGLSVARHLQKHGALVTVNDYKPMAENKGAQALVEEGVRVITGFHPLDLLDEDFVFMVKNPGIPYDNPLVQAAVAKGLPIYTDIELASWINCGTLVGVTGSNGKTTTTSLIAEILAADEHLPGQVKLGGNIGIPALDVCDGTMPDDVVVLELSSFQLQGTERFRPHIAALTNFTPTHMDFHHTEEAYLAAKWKITAQQTPKDFLLLNQDDPVLWARREQTNAQVIPFSIKEEHIPGAWFQAETQELMWQEEAIVHRDDLFLPGRHNLANALVAVAVAQLLGVSKEAIRTGMHNFHGVPHRIQFVGEVLGRQFYNDSKATNNRACQTALSSFQAPTIWLCGGKDRGTDPRPLAPYLKHVKACIAMGEEAPQFMALAEEEGIQHVKKAKDMDEAVTLAYGVSEPGDIILLSPACASWDQYLNFEERGEHFMSAMVAVKRQTEEGK